ncbi:unnamed protein product [Bursaphelenchus okinawaensis]|uniref:G_PROTEIN_RECEP_F1_2 domain-containing protein n=1 Tax=Bursaphelenchus okinawaensis TaxID=465554 RepID=A0A811KMZ1_9BILA|nr:unnamed protein product [Bursaphelenchus okinawaensis]CAG9105559.1 unnamed protein product [Bursaphelenchus okinawaensis]
MAKNSYAWENSSYSSDSTVSTELYDVCVRISKVSHYCAFTSGMILSLTLACLIMQRTDTIFKTYKTMLIFNCFTDRQFLVVGFLCQFTFRLNEGVALASIEGPASALSYTGQSVITGIFAASLGVVITSLPANYCYRYQYLKHSTPPKIHRLLLLYVISYLVVIPVGFFTAYYFNQSGLARPHFNYGSLWYNTQPLPTLLVMDFSIIGPRLHIAYCFVCFGGACVLALGFALKTLTYYTEHEKLLNTRSLRLHSQLSKALLIQSSLPMIASMGPSVIIIAAILFGLDCGVLTILMFNIYAFVPILNPLCTIFVIKPFRKEVLKRFTNRIPQEPSFLQSKTRVSDKIPTISSKHVYGRASSSILSRKST